MTVFTPIFNAVKRDKSYVVSAVVTFSLVLMMLFQHNWQIKIGSNLPSAIPAFSEIKDVKEKKRQFFNYLRPFIAKENNRIKYKRALLNTLVTNLKNESYHSSVNIKKLNKLAREFGLSEKGILQNLEELKKRIDIIPSSLVLVQAANESAWGTSRFAVQANNLFGQWCYSKGCGIIPKKRNTGSHHEVRKYNSIEASVASYMRNLNSHRSYKELREIRANLRSSGRLISGIKLAQGLSKYSERGEHYVKELTQMIKQNRLE